MYDFMVFGYYAASIAKTYFPSGSEFLSLMLSLATFGAALAVVIRERSIAEHGRRRCFSTAMQ